MTRALDIGDGPTSTQHRKLVEYAEPEEELTCGVDLCNVAPGTTVIVVLGIDGEVDQEVLFQEHDVQDDTLNIVLPWRKVHMEGVMIRLFHVDFSHVTMQVNPGVLEAADQVCIIHVYQAAEHNFAGPDFDPPRNAI